METNLKIVVPVAIVGLVIIAIIISVKNTAPVTPIAEQPRVVTPVISTPTPPPVASVSGNVDDMMSVLANEAGGDAVLVASVADSAAVVKSDTQEVNSLTTAYDETTF